MKDLDFIQVGDLAREIAAAGATPVGDLAGTSVELSFENGERTRYTFADAQELQWESEGPDGRRSGSESYWALSPRPGIYFVDYVGRERPTTSVSLVLDREAGVATQLTGTLPTRDRVRTGAFDLASAGLDLTFVEAEFRNANLDGPFDASGPHHQPTAEMAGHRVQYTYGPTESYEHIYLNEKLYTWQCLSGIEKGLADTDRCHAYKIADELYLFVWREKIVPTLGVVMADWQQMRSQGKLFGYESDDFGATTNVCIVSKAHLLNVTTYVR